MSPSFLLVYFYDKSWITVSHLINFKVELRLMNIEEDMRDEHRMSESGWRTTKLIYVDSDAASRKWIKKLLYLLYVITWWWVDVLFNFQIKFSIKRKKNWNSFITKNSTKKNDKVNRVTLSLEIRLQCMQSYFITHITLLSWYLLSSHTALVELILKIENRDYSMNVFILSIYYLHFTE